MWDVYRVVLPLSVLPGDMLASGSADFFASKLEKADSFFAIYL